METLRFRAYAAFVLAIFSSITVMLISCNGNGGGSDSYGETYIPISGPSSGSTGSSDIGSGITAQDILNLSNADDTDSIIRIFGTASSGQSQSQTVVLTASDIGLPAGGSATLVISEGLSFTQTAQADADGNVTFQIPAIASGTDITVSLSVKNASGDSININLTLRRQFWILPASIVVTASPDGFVYDSSQLDSASSTLTVSGLEGAPAGAAISYAWTDEAGLSVGSGATLTRTMGELIGSTAMTAATELTRTYTVTASYTDAAGELKTVSADASVTVGPPVTIPAFTVKITPPSSYDTANSTTSRYALVNGTDPFTFEPELPSGASFPAGTVFSWNITKVGGTAPVTGTGTNVSKTPAELGVAASIGTWKVNCTASNSRAAAPVLAPEKVMQSRLLELPAITLIQTTSVTGCAPSDNTTFSGDSYAFADASSGSFTLTAVTSGAAVTGMQYNWTITGSPFSYSSTGNTCTITPSDLPGFASHVNDAGSWTVQCELTYPGLSPVLKTTTLSAFLLKIPEFTISVSAGAGLNEDSSSSASKRVFLVGTTDLDKTISFTATPKSGEPDFPTGTQFTWSTAPASPTTSLSSNAQINVFCSAVPSSQTEITVTCTASYAGLSGGPVEAKFDLKPRIRLNAPSGLRVSSAGIYPGTTSVPGSGGVYTYPSGTSLSDVRIGISYEAPTIPAGKTFKFFIWVSGTAGGSIKDLTTTPIAGGATGTYTFAGTTLGGWGSHQIAVIAFLSPSDPEYEDSPLSSKITVTINGGP